MPNEEFQNENENENENEFNERNENENENKNGNENENEFNERNDDETTEAFEEDGEEVIVTIFNFLTYVVSHSEQVLRSLVEIIFFDTKTTFSVFLRDKF